MDLDLQLENVTPEHSFMFMLKDLIYANEDRCDSLQSRLNNISYELPRCIPYQWMRFRITKKVNYTMGADSEQEDAVIEDEQHYVHLREKCINAIFSTRTTTNPVFAYWHWRVLSREDTYELNVYIRFGNPTPIKCFDFLYDLFASLHVNLQVIPIYGGTGEVKMLVKDRLGYTHNYPYISPDHGVDIWRKGGDEYEAPLETEWVQGDFLCSKNYLSTEIGLMPSNRSLLMMIQTNQWIELFHLDYCV